MPRNKPGSPQRGSCGTTHAFARRAARVRSVPRRGIRSLVFVLETGIHVRRMNRTSVFKTGTALAFGLVACAVLASKLADYIPTAAGPARMKTSEEFSSQVALTFDDLPSHGPLPPGLTRMDVARRIIEAPKRGHAPPTYGFVNGKALKQDPSTTEVLRLWRDAGFPLGNHTFSHTDLNSSTLGTFEQDILENEQVLREFMGEGDWHWFRFPYLNEGSTAENHRAILAFLSAHRYRVAEVSLSFADYEYNDPYARCLAKQDQQGIESLKQSYLSRAAQTLDHGQHMARLAAGRDIRHIMLLHLGGFETVMLPRLLELLSRRHFQLIPLPQAESDPVYAADPILPSAWSGAFLQQALRSKHMVPYPAEGPAAQLATLCR
jgi:peptidoglycan-N-acetylglucosamine deacetylase